MRIVKIATVSFLMEDEPNTHTVELNLDRARAYALDAGKAGADIICLPETVTTNGLAEPWNYAAEFPKWSAYFAETARMSGSVIIAPTLAEVNGTIYNQASVFAADGKLLGVYQKAQPNGAELSYIRPGDNFPVIDIGFAKIGIMICMDIYFPEIARIYAMKGAEMLFWPTVAHGPTQSGLEAQLRSRAIDNSLYIVESNLAGHPPYAPYAGRFYPCTARIVDFNGDVIAQTGRREGIAFADIDLDDIRLTQDCVLIHSPDNTRSDLESLVRMDLYAKEYAALSGSHSADIP